MSNDTYEQEWIEVDEPSLTGEEVQEVEDTIDQLDTLEDQVEDTDEVAALEAYNYAFDLINHYNQLPSGNVSLESYNGSRNKKKQLLNGIRTQKNLIKNQLTVALEAFVKNAPDELSNAVDKYNEAVEKLEKATAKIDTDARSNVKVDSTRIWDMFHIDGKLMEDGEEAIDEEVIKLKAIVRNVKSMADSLIKGKEITVQNDEHFMMFNRKLVIDNNGIDVTSEKVKAPVKSFSTGQIIGITVGVMFFWPAAVGYALIADKKNDQAISNKDIVKLKAIASKVEKMDSYVNELCGIVNKFHTNKEIDNKEKHKVISAALVVIKQITEVTNGIAVMFNNIK